MAFAAAYIPDAAYGMPLYKQIQDGVENQHLECSDPDHLLVVSPGLRFACMTAGTAQKAGWPEPAFTEDGDTVVNLALEIEVDGETFVINSTLTNGFAYNARYGPVYFGEYDVITLLIDTYSTGGRIEMVIPCEVARHCDGLEEHQYSIHAEEVRDGKLGDTIGFGKAIKPDQDEYTVGFPLSGADQVFGFTLYYPV